MCLWLNLMVEPHVLLYKIFASSMFWRLFDRIHTLGYCLRYGCSSFSASSTSPSPVPKLQPHKEKDFLFIKLKYGYEYGYSTHKESEC